MKNMKINELKKYGLHLSIEWKKVLTCSSDIEDVTDKELQNIKSVTDYLDLDSVWQKHDVDDSDTISESERYTLIDNQGNVLVEDLSIEEMDQFIKNLRMLDIKNSNWKSLNLKSLR
ncbi:hypothetical protein [Lactobacillus crispatus]|uniref:hypothetical protein n=1 Tax=Lactobacillus crispatus TaxID=47770 RepID=UPI0010611492|nr:hypothetical protein [Lactobacillus crispatus]TDN09480.1 hypothetical protein CEE83_11555 [Lactobacillus crispatus]